jgi:hypothetical protein
MKTAPTLLAGSSAALALVTALTLAAPPRAAGPKRPSPSPSASPAAITGAGTWAEVDKLVEEQKYEAASEAVARIRERAQAAGQEDDWTRAIVREVQLRTALHGYETAVRFLRETPWPKGRFARVVLDLFYGRTLVDYLNAYSWEIRSRERVESGGPIDLKKWTREQIGEEALRAYARAFGEREALGTDPVDRFGDFVQRGNYPAEVRGTARDTVTYLFAELLADTSYWSPEQNEVYRLDLATLLGDVKTRPTTRPSIRSRRWRPCSATSRPGTRRRAVTRRPSKRGSSASAACGCRSRTPRTGAASSPTSSSASLPTASGPGGRWARPCEPSSCGTPTIPTLSCGRGRSPRPARPRIPVRSGRSSAGPSWPRSSNRPTSSSR